MNTTLRKKLISLLGNDDHSPVESKETWRELAAELHAELDGTVGYAGGYLTAMEEKLGAQDPMTKRVAKQLRYTNQTFLKPWWDADRQRQKKRQLFSTDSITKPKL
jgi:hypothetical protein